MIEDKMVLNGVFERNLEPSDNLDFTIGLTMDCNMQCYYCYEKEFRDKKSHMTRERIDAIFDFYAFCRTEYGSKGSVSEIGITGGEPLINRETARLVKYISEKWSDSKVTVITNGVNLLKYYDELPIGKSLEFIISLDGLKDTHLKRRYSGIAVDERIYDDIIAGIKRLLSDGVSVKIQAVLDKNNYHELPQLYEFLLTEGILTSPTCTFKMAHVMDFANQYGINEDFNNKQEILMMQNYLVDNNMPYNVSFYGLAKLFELIVRPANEPFIPECNICNTGFLSKCFFAPDGNIYFCNSFNEGKGIIGTYFPKVSVDKDVVSLLASRSVMNHTKCRKCPYKFICLGNCPKTSEGLGEEMTCGIFSDPDIMSNLEFNYQPHR